MHRLFVAIDLPEEIREQLFNICGGIPGAKWTAKDQFHITLNFIGNVDRHTMEEIGTALSKITVNAFEIVIKETGFFPPKKEPRILWIGVEKSSALIHLQKKIERSLIAVDIAPEKRKFHAHVTLARLNHSPVSKVVEYLAEHNLFKTQKIPVNEFVLYESFLSSKGATYLKVASFTLED